MCTDWMVTGAISLSRCLAPLGGGFLRSGILRDFYGVLDLFAEAGRRGPVRKVVDFRLFPGFSGTRENEGVFSDGGSLSRRDGFTQFGKTCICSPQFADRTSPAYGAGRRSNSSDDRMNDTKSHWVPVFAGGKYLCRLKKK